MMDTENNSFTTYMRNMQVIFMYTNQIILLHLFSGAWAFNLKY